MKIEIADISAEMVIGNQIMDLLVGKTLHEAMLILSSVVAAAFTVGQQLRDAPPDDMHELFAKLCIAGHEFRESQEKYPVLERGQC